MDRKRGKKGGRIEGKYGRIKGEEKESNIGGK